MNINKDKLASAFSEVEEILMKYTLPSWEYLPDIDLYMDQVVAVVTKYLEFPNDALKLSRPVTSSMINNYVKLGIIPPPVKKRYSKVHLAYLLIVCTLKQTLDMTTIQQIIPVNLDIEDVKRTYDSFARNQHTAFNYVFGQTRKVADNVFSLEGNNPDRINDLIMQVSVSANLFKLLTDKIAHLENE